MQAERIRLNRKSGAAKRYPRAATQLLLFVLSLIIGLSACGGGAAVDPANPQAGSAVRSMQLLTDSHGWALTDAGLRWTSDGGKNWGEIRPPGVAATAIRGAFFLNTDDGWVVVAENATESTDDLVLFRTSDGGESWALSPLGSRSADAGGAPAYIHFFDTQNGWIVLKQLSSSNASVGVLFRTTDSGETWQKLSIPIGEPVRFLTATEGWTAGGPAGDELYLTRDAGSSWERVQVDLPANFDLATPTYELPVFGKADELLLSVTFTGDSSGVSLFESTDRGRSWRLRRSLPYNLSLSTGSSIPADIVEGDFWVVLMPDGSGVFRGPSTVEALLQTSPNGLPAGVYDVDFATSQVGWALLRYGACPPGIKSGCTEIEALLQTTDGGQTWVPLIPAELLS